MFNRGFLYGDGFFETIRLLGDEVPLLKWHLGRARESADIMEMNWPEDWTDDYIRDKILACDRGNDNVIRVDFFRKGGGTYVPENDDMEMSVSSRHISDENNLFLPGVVSRAEVNRQLSELQPVPVGFYFAEQKPVYSLSSVKSLSAAFYVKAGLYLRRQDRIKDLLLVNQMGNVCEALTSNVLIRDKGQWQTPANHQGPVKGVYLQFLRSFMDIRPSTITIEQLSQADEIYLVNAVRGFVKAVLM